MVAGPNHALALASPGPVTPQQVVDAGLIVREQGSATREAAERHLQGLGVDAKVLWEDPSLYSGELMTMKAQLLAAEKREADKPGTESFDTGAPRTRAGGPKNYLDNLKNGEPLPSAADIDRITARYLN